MICIQICCDLEWQAVKSILGFNKDSVDIYPFGEYTSCSYSGKECIFFNGGDTKTRSAAATQYAIDNWNPDLLIAI